ncbi:hypothetical protein AGOR_G00047580 [Albula goreensis]|uniref:Fibronectin type-III domain-containing protein n=1 Tax=Albula goreensis TaxID=1534307 RepID=A0A8T3DTL9_9TELE|nr:hypothetical protein AGOR_G00047580 [Albula goreensis]
MDSFLLWALLLSMQVGVSLSQNGFQPPVPQGVHVKPDFASQVLSVTWEKDSSSPTLSYDIQVLHTELMEIVYHDTVDVKPDSSGKVYHWNWTSPLPLECTSHSVRIRSRQQSLTSDWSPLETIPGMDIPVETAAKMYPQDKVVAVGSNITVCCIVKEGNFSRTKFLYSTASLNGTQLSRRSYALTLTNQPPSISSGTNVICLENNGIVGTVVFVGYPPGDKDLVCETRDLVSVECQWSKGQDTHLLGTRMTYYTLNGRDCPLSKKELSHGESLYCNSVCDKLTCQLKATMVKGESTWTLEARNPLGMVQLTDTADLSRRVWPYAPVELTAMEIHSRYARLHWQWKTEGYKTLDLECQVQVNNSGHTHTFESTGQGQLEAELNDLQPYETYRVRVRCRLQTKTWKWGDWSSVYGFQTKEESPDALDIWVWMDSNQTGYVKWKPLTKSQSRGKILGYEVTHGNPEDGNSVKLSQNNYSLPLTFGDSDEHVVMVTTWNSAGVSPVASITFPRFFAGEMPTYKVSGIDRGFNLSWAAGANASCGYVVEWCPTGKWDCDVQWEKVPAGNTSARIESKVFEAGVRYNISVYGCTSGAPELLERSQGYVEELAPSQPVPGIKAHQSISDIVLSWDEIPMEYQRGFISGYTVYINNNSLLIPIVNITDPDIRNYTMRHPSPGSYKFTVKAHTSGGEDVGVTVDFKLNPSIDMLVAEILIALGAMTGILFIITILCYKKRQWVKKTFYPDIPEPKVPEEWSTPPKMLAVEPCSPNTVHIVEKPEICQTVVLEDEEGGDRTEEAPADTDSSDAVHLQYYNQVVDHGSQGSRSTDSSASSSTSMASTRTEVTYTGIQSSASSSGGSIQPEAPLPAGYRPQMAPAPIEIQAEPADIPLLGEFSGYQPQSTWKADSPESTSLNSSLGSPTSVSSSQFLLPDPASEEGADRAPSTTWFHNLLSGKP